MSDISIQMMKLLSELVIILPVGTNLSILHVLWMLVSGQLLVSRGAVYPGLSQLGLSRRQVQRAGQALRSCGWSMGALLVRWEDMVLRSGHWQVRYHGGYCSLAVDLTGFWRPTLKKCPSKHYHHGAGKALPAIVLGLIGRVGAIGSQRLALPLKILGLTEEMDGEAGLMKALFKQAKELMTGRDVLVADGGFSLKLLLSEKIERYVIKMAKNCTARRSTTPEYQNSGRPAQRGEYVRPLARTYRGKTIPATPPDRTISWQEDDKTITAQAWDNLVLSTTTAAQFANADQVPLVTFSIIAFFDPDFEQPLLVATNLTIEVKHVQALYLDRWPIEQLPLAAKQMIGAKQAFVSNPTACLNLPALSILAGSILSCMAAMLPPIPTGFWDRKPKATPGRLRRVLFNLGFPSHFTLPSPIRQKSSVTEHLPMGFWKQRTKSSQN